MGRNIGEKSLRVQTLSQQSSGRGRRGLLSQAPLLQLLLLQVTGADAATRLVAAEAEYFERVPLVVVCAAAVANKQPGAVHSARAGYSHHGRARCGRSSS